MPPSNKKKRGRQRRNANANANANKDSSVAVAAAAKEGDEDVLEDLTVTMSLLKLTGTVCTHGFPDVPKGHVVWDAFKFLGTEESSEGIPFTAVKNMVTRFPQVVLDDESYSLLKAMLLSLGAKMLLDHPHDLSIRHKEVKWFAHRVVYLEVEYDIHHVNLSERFNHEKHRHPSVKKYFKKTRDLIDGGGRSLIVFFAKRIPCNCVRDMYEEVVKTQKKMGKCDNCRVEKEYNSLKKCKRCDIAHYCNRECQVADWPKHKEGCKKTKS